MPVDAPPDCRFMHQRRQLQRPPRRQSRHSAQRPDSPHNDLQHLRRTRHKPCQCSRPGRAGRGDPPAKPRLRDPQRSGRLHQPHGKGCTPGPRPRRQTRHGVALLEGHRPRRRRIRRRRTVKAPDSRNTQLPASLRGLTTRRGPLAVRHPRRDRRQGSLCRLNAPRPSFGRCEPHGAGQ